MSGRAAQRNQGDDALNGQDATSGPSHHYDEAFYRYISEGALRSARIVLAELEDALGERPADVLDVGCGAGAWLAGWKERGARVFGVDGAHVNRAALMIGQDEFEARDLSQPFDLGRRFALVQCLEVAEHLPESASAGLVQSLCRHGDVVLFSAAPPGQGGEHHINEQPYAYWRDQFARAGFAMFDPLRPRVVRDGRIEVWYRYNSFVFVREDARADLHARLAPVRVGANAMPVDRAPFLYRLRRRAVALLGPGAATRIAVLKKHVVNLLGRS